jgi:UDP-N-acetyl-D-mannosaminuronate dehydrogenase
MELDKTYFIKNAEGDIVNTIVASLDFVSSNYEHYEEYIDEEKVKQEAREWRDQELKDTDWVVPIVDHSQHSQYLLYRQALRDWTATEDFPDTRPTLGI